MNPYLHLRISAVTLQPCYVCPPDKCALCLPRLLCRQQHIRMFVHTCLLGTEQKMQKRIMYGLDLVACLRRTHHLPCADRQLAESLASTRAGQTQKERGNASPARSLIPTQLHSNANLSTPARELPCTDQQQAESLAFARNGVT